jgi:biotin transport system permease protein
MPAGLKLIFVIITSAFAFASVYGLAASILFVLIASAAARIPPHNLLKGSKPLVILSLCIILLKTIRLEGEGITALGLHIPFISREGFLEGLFAAPGLFVPFAAAALLFSVTTMRELRLSLALVEKSVIRFFSSPGVAARKLFKQTANMPSAKEREHTPFFSLGISLMLGFIPRFFEMWDDANLACDSRSCKRGLRRLFLLIPLVTERMMEASANTALALEARSWGLGTGE